VLALVADTPMARAHEPSDATTTVGGNGDRNGDGTGDGTGVRPSWGPAVGALTALVPLAVGGALMAHDHQPAMGRAGVTVMVSGFAAAPWVAYGLGHQWRRGLVFGLTALAASAGTLVAMSAQDPFDPTIDNHHRLAFGTLLTTSFFASAFGLIDSFIAGPSPRER
jgi:hypothetical protein